MASVSYCLNPKCPNPSDPSNADRTVCRHCGSELLLQGRYRILQPLGGGGFGKTFEVDDRGTRKVLKVLLKEHPKAVALFKQEADVLSRLRHPGIPKVERDGYFTFTPEDSKEAIHCLVMEKIEGANLQDWLKNRGRPITEEQAVNWLKQLTQILDQVHGLQYFHRDIKPHNIMCKPNGQLVLIDFGTAREVSATYFAKVGQGQNVTGIVSPGYSPPEQTNGKAVPQSDFFALGRTFVYLLTGKPPTAFPENPRTGKLMWRKGAPHISDGVANVIDYLMAPFPGNRPQNPQVILHHLSLIKLEEEDDMVTSPLPQTPSSLKGSKANTKQPQTRQNTSIRQTAQRYTQAPSARKPVKRHKKKLLAALGILILGLTCSQIYGSVRYAFFPSNPLWLLSGLPSSYWLKQSLKDSGPIKAIALDRDGKTLASGSFGIRVWDLKSGKQLRSLKGHSDWVEALAITPDGKTLVSASADKTIRLWNLQTGIQIRKLLGHTGAVKAIAISPDGKMIVSGSEDKTVRLWNLQTGARMRILAGHQGAVNAVAISSDGQTLATGGDDKTVRLWNLQTGQLRKTFSGHAGVVNAVAISADGKMLASGSADNSVMLWELKTGKRLRILRGENSWIRTVAFSPDSKTLLSGAGSSIEVWNPKTGQRLNSLVGHSQYVSDIVISRDGKTLVSGSPDQTIKVWQMPKT